ncbi:MAG: hypothetical protein QOF33_3786, partial [Thermomicrobiales bacterium]|nr:hypothetical protein [Thermomicrobiales bacterium]
STTPPLPTREGVRIALPALPFHVKTWSMPTAAPSFRHYKRPTVQLRFS